MTRYFSSGLYIEPFYTKHELNLHSDHEAREKIEYDKELLAQHYADRHELDYDEYNEWDKWEQVDNEFWTIVAMRHFCYEPQVFDEEVALKCGLTPFTYEVKNMLALSGCDMDLSPRLDAYQALVHGTIDKLSKLFSDRDYFNNVVGDSLTQEALKALSSGSPKMQ